MIDYETFEKYLSKIVTKLKKMEEIDTAFRKANCIFEYPTCIDEATDLLAMFAGDKSGWIDHWIFELNCGEWYVDGSITSDGKNVPLKTIKDLWDCIRMGG